MARPTLAQFLLPVRFDRPPVLEALLLVTNRTGVADLLGLMDKARRLKRAVGRSAKIVLRERLYVAKKPEQLVWEPRDTGGIPSAMPLDPNVLDSIGEFAIRTANLFVDDKSVRWEIPRGGQLNAFRTGEVFWGDLMEFRFVMTTKTGRPGVFRTLSEREPLRALEILKRGRCFLHGYAGNAPYQVRVPLDAMDALLTHENANVRESAVSLLNSPVVERG